MISTIEVENDLDVLLTTVYTPSTAETDLLPASTYHVPPQILSPGKL